MKRTPVAHGPRIGREHGMCSQAQGVVSLCSYQAICSDLIMTQLSLAAGRGGGPEHWAQRERKGLYCSLTPKREGTGAPSHPGKPGSLGAPGGTHTLPLPCPPPPGRHALSHYLVWQEPAL